MAASQEIMRFRLFDELCDNTMKNFPNNDNGGIAQNGGQSRKREGLSMLQLEIPLIQLVHSRSIANGICSADRESVNPELDSLGLQSSELGLSKGTRNQL